MTHLQVIYEGILYPVLSMDKNHIVLLNTDTGEIFSKELKDVRVPKKLCVTYTRNQERYADGY